MWKKNTNWYVFEKGGQDGYTGCVLKQGLWGMEVRMDLEGQSCFGTGVTCRGNFHFLVVLVLGDILMNVTFPEREDALRVCICGLNLEFQNPLSVSSPFLVKWERNGTKGFQLDLLAASSVLCHIVLYYLFPPFTVMLQVQSLISLLAAAPKTCGSSWAQLVVQRKHVGRCRWLCLCCEYLRIDVVTERRFSAWHTEANYVKYK